MVKQEIFGQLANYDHIILLEQKRDALKRRLKKYARQDQTPESRQQLQEVPPQSQKSLPQQTLPSRSDDAATLQLARIPQQAVN